jgi:hypothetical protein
MFTITIGAEGLSILMGYWDPTIYIVYYTLASFQVAIMGAGALYLFADREIINSRNSGAMMVLFGIVWTFFSLIYVPRTLIFLWILIPSIVILLTGAIYWIQIQFRDPEASIKFSGMKFVHLFIVFTVYIFIIMGITAFNAPLDLNFLMNSGGKEVAGGGWLSDLPGARATVRLFSPFNTVPGSIALIGGAFYSYASWQWSIRKRTGKFNPKIGLFNLYIGVGALALTIGGTLSGFGFGVLYISEAISLVLMYFGFLESDKITMRKLVSGLTLGWLRHPEPQKIRTDSR